MHLYVSLKQMEVIYIYIHNTDGLVQERRNSIVLTHWSYVFFALTHRYAFSIIYWITPAIIVPK